MKEILKVHTYVYECNLGCSWHIYLDNIWIIFTFFLKNTSKHHTSGFFTMEKNRKPDIRLSFSFRLAKISLNPEGQVNRLKTRPLSHKYRLKQKTCCKRWAPPWVDRVCDRKRKSVAGFFPFDLHKFSKVRGGHPSKKLGLMKSERWAPL